jgi:uncharacterized protein with von Willebrand factor type A (vWA) domain
MAKNTRLAELLQFNERLREWLDSPQQRALREQFQRLAESPPWRELDEQMRRLAESPLPRQQQQALEALARSLEEPPPKAPRSMRSKTKAGRKRILTDDEIKQLQTAYRTIRKDKPTLSQKRVFDNLRKLLPPDKHGISDTTLRDHIVPPTTRK